MSAAIALRKNKVWLGNRKRRFFSEINASARLNAAEGKAMGPWTSLHSLSRTRFGIMPGDTVRMSVYAKYDQPTKTREAISGMAGIIAGAITGGAADVDAVGRVTKSISETLKGGQAALLAKNNDIPKAYLNYIFFDKEMKSKETNFTQVTEAAHGSFEKLEMEFIAEEEGYLMTYTANETNEDLNVFMDDFSVMHTTGPIVRVDDYYPFGLTFNTSELNGKLTNKFLYNGGTELMDDLGLNWYKTFNRLYAPDIGRFRGIDALSDMMPGLSPMVYSYNNPVYFNDPLGLMGGPGDDEDNPTYEGQTLPEIVVSASRISVDYTYLATWIWSPNPIKRATGFEYNRNGLEGVYQQWNTNMTIRRTEGLGYETEFMKGMKRMMGGITIGILGAVVAAYAAPMLVETAIVGAESGVFSFSGKMTAKAIGYRMGVDAGSQTIANVATKGLSGWRDLDAADVVLAGTGLNYFSSAGIASTVDFRPFSKQNVFTTVFDGKGLGETAVDFGVGIIAGGQEGLLNNLNASKSAIYIFNATNQAKATVFGGMINKQINGD